MNGAERVNRMYKPLIAVVAATTLLLVGGASTASAFQIPNAQYTGTHSAGGGVSFRVSVDGNAVREFRVENYTGEFCDVEVLQHGVGAPIVNNAFSFSLAEDFSYSGSFPGVQLAQGTFTDEECASGPLTWSASTTASPAGSAVCIAAQGPAAEAEAAYAAAQARVSQTSAKFKRNVKQANNAKRAVRRAVKKKAKAQVKRKVQNRLRAAIKQRTRTNRELRLAKAASAQAAAAMAQAQAAKAAVCGPGV